MSETKRKGKSPQREDEQREFYYGRTISHELISDFLSLIMVFCRNFLFHLTVGKIFSLQHSALSLS